MNKYIEEYETFITKEYYLKNHIENMKSNYNKIKDGLKITNDSFLKKVYEKQFNEVKIKCLLFNSILKNDKKNIIENFNKLKIYNMETIEFWEDISNDVENDENNYHYTNDEENSRKGGEQYLIICNQKKIEYEFFIYVIEDYNNIKL